MLSDGTLRLEQLSSAHLQGLADLGHDVDVQRYTYVPSPWEEGFENTWLARYEQGHAEGTRAGFAIVDEESGDFLGLAALVHIDHQGNQAEAGYIVAPQARGRGVAQRALQLLTGWALDDLGLARVELRITADNPASIRVAERSGFAREGVLRSVHLKQGIRTDVAVYSRIAGDER
ncbi:MAG TPA: GNAT family protein [Gaiellaceae bacterium]|nr:GNAT family protein [Gaiellaceae bacterium]